MNVGVQIAARLLVDALYQVGESHIDATLLDEECASLRADRTGGPHPIFEATRLRRRIWCPLDRLGVVEVAIDELLDVVVLFGLAVRVHGHVVGETARLVVVVGDGSAARSVDSRVVLWLETGRALRP